MSDDPTARITAALAALAAPHWDDCSMEGARQAAVQEHAELTELYQAVTAELPAVRARLAAAEAVVAAYKVMQDPGLIDTPGGRFPSRGAFGNALAAYDALAGTGGAQADDRR